MAPIIEVDGGVLADLDKLGIRYNLREDTPISVQTAIETTIDNYTYIPSAGAGFYFSNHKGPLNENWFETHKALSLKKLALPDGTERQLRMPIIPEFIEALKYLKIHNPELYKEITEQRNPWRANWLDADFKVINRVLYINYNHVIDVNGNPVPKNSEPMDKDTLMENRTPGISLDSWLENPTPQGFPRKTIDKGDLDYWYPKSDNNSVAGFVVYSFWRGLFCGRGPSNGNPALGVFAVA